MLDYNISTEMLQTIGAVLLLLILSKRILQLSMAILSAVSSLVLALVGVCLSAVLLVVAILPITFVVCNTTDVCKTTKLAAESRHSRHIEKY